MRLIIQFSLRLAIGIVLGGVVGCSLFFGNIRPLQEKSRTYTVLDLSAKSSNWTPLEADPSLDHADNSSDVPRFGGADFAYESKKWGATISIDSACGQPYSQSQNLSLKKLTKQLLLGVSHVNSLIQKSVVLKDIPALLTHIEGIIDEKPVILTTLVLRTGKCVYDLIYLGTPQHFKDGEEDFSRFVNSIEFK